MRRLQALAGVLSLGGAVYLFAAGSARPDVPPEQVPPSIQISPTVHDFGDIESQDALITQFTITNTYPDPVEVVQVMKGCACSSAEVEPRTIPPGGHATLSVSWRVGGKQGRISESIMLMCRVGSGKQPVVARLAGRMVSVVEPDRDEIELDCTARVGRVNFRSRGGRPFRLTGAVANHPSLTATIDPAGRSLDIAFNPAERNWDSGRLQVVVTTDVPDAPSLKLSVSLKKALLKPSTQWRRGA